MPFVLAPSTESTRRLFFQLSKMITSHVDLLDASARLGVTLSTLRKILAGDPVSHFIHKKIGRALEGRECSVPIRRKQSNVERLLEVYHLYQEQRALRKVADEIGLSHERVRQLLVKGSAFGLFEYKPAQKIELSREKILDDYRRFCTLKGVAQANRISISSLKRLLKVNRIGRFELKEIWVGSKKGICRERYDAIVGELGHHPTTTELQGVSSTRYLSVQIRRFWGSMEAFRSDHRIPPPPVGKLRPSKDLNREKVPV